MSACHGLIKQQGWGISGYNNFSFCKWGQHLPGAILRLPFSHTSATRLVRVVTLEHTTFRVKRHKDVISTVPLFNRDRLVNPGGVRLNPNYLLKGEPSKDCS